ncbi:hypothetical protein [Merismopedia glauca]
MEVIKKDVFINGDILKLFIPIIFYYLYQIRIDNPFLTLAVETAAT